MSISKILRLGFVSLLIVSFCSCGKQQDITVSKISGAKIIRLNQKGIELEIGVKIKNPNAYGFTIYPSELSVKLNNTDLGVASIKGKTKIKARSEEEHKLIVHSEFSSLFSGGLLSLIALVQKKSLDVALKGDIKTGTFFYRKTFPVNLKENISLSEMGK